MSPEVRNLRITTLSPPQQSPVTQSEAGIIGKIFGFGKTTSINFGGFIAIIGLCIPIICILQMRPISDIIEVSKAVSPIITLALGYMFGSKRQE